MTQQEFQQMLAKYKAGLCSDEERSIVESFDERLLENNTIELSERQSRDLEKKYLDQIESALAERRSKIRRLWRPYVGVAASVIILCTMVYVIQRQLIPENPATRMKAFANRSLKTMEVNLPDQSTILLEPGGVLTYEEDALLHTREVVLKGTAFFKVYKDVKRPFIVYTGDVVTTVLGTSFTVEAEKDKNVVVWVRTGRVSVSSPGEGSSKKSEVILTPNHKAIVDTKLKTVATTLVQKPVPLTDLQPEEKLRFDNAPATEVMHALEDIYGVDIVFDEELLGKCKLKTSVSKGELFSRLDIICNAIGATYSLEGTRIIIHSSGCD